MKPKTILFTIIVIMCALFALSAYKIGYQKSWRLWGVQTMAQPFSDARSFTNASESYALGFDPMYENPQDPWKRTMNLPRLWQLIFLLKTNRTHTISFGITFILMFFSGVFLFLKKIEKSTVIFLCICLFSPATMLGLERCNADLPVFFFVCFSLWLSYRSSLAALIGLLFAAALKYFPIFGLTLFLKEQKKKFFVYGLLGSVLFLSYIYLTKSDFKQILLTTPNGVFNSYGISLIPFHIHRLFNSWTVAISVNALLYVLTGIIMLWSLFVRSRITVAKEFTDSDHLEAFRVGSSIYIGTYLLGSNFDYRLIFLILTIPQLVRWSCHLKTKEVLVSRIALGLVTLSFWSNIATLKLKKIDHGEVMVYMFNDIPRLLAFYFLLYLFIVTLPYYRMFALNDDE